MPALDFNVAGFGLLLNRPSHAIETDLSNASVLQVIDYYERFRRKSNPTYKLSSEKYNIKKVERQFGITITPDIITDEFWVHFQMYLLSQGIKGSTVQKYCGTIVAAMKWGTRHKLSVTSTFDCYDRRMCAYERSKVALSPDEVSFIAHFDLSSVNMRPQKRRRLARIRDQFVLQCNLGQRYSDISRIKPSCFSEDKSIYTCVQQKTGNKAVVDIKQACFDRRVVRKILSTYNYSAPYPHDISSFNKGLHELLKIMGGTFNELVKTENKVRGEIIVVELPKWKVVSSHTARRSFASYNVMRGIKEVLIRRWTGHKDSKAFAKYIIYDED